jgi:hypothetical protein
MSISITNPYKKNNNYYCSLSDYSFDLTVMGSLYNGYLKYVESENTINYDNIIIEEWDVSEEDIKSNGHFNIVENSITKLLEEKSMEWFQVENDIIKECFNFTRNRLSIMNTTNLRNIKDIEDGDIILNISPRLIKINEASFDIIYEINDTILLKENNKKLRKKKLNFTRMIRVQEENNNQQTNEDENNQQVNEDEMSNIKTDDLKEYLVQGFEDHNNKDEIKQRMISVINQLYDRSIKMRQSAEELKENYFMMFPEEVSKE